MGDYTLEQALAMASKNSTRAVDDAIHVNIETREVTVPESQKLFGVESDDSVEIKHIIIDGRYVDGNKDLSKLTWRIVYRNANKDPSSYYLIPSIVVNENSIEMDWLIKRSVVAYKGTIDFIVCGFATDSSGVTTPEWNSTLGQGYALEGLEVSAIDIGKEAVDELAKILNETIAARDIAKAASEDASKTAASMKNSLDQISQNTASIAKNTSNIAALRDGKISKFYASSQGETTLPDSDSGRIVDLMLYGKSSQDGTPTPDAPVEIKSVVNPVVKVTGKNLLKTTATTTTVHGVTCTRNSDGTYTLNGTATGTVTIALTDDFKFSQTVQAGIQYRLVGMGVASTTSAFYLGIQQWDKDYNHVQGNDDVGNGTNFKRNSRATYIRVYFKAVAGETLVNLVIKPMITTDMSATYDDYIPYTETSAKLPYTLNAIPVSSGGNVTVDGQQYIADYVDVEKGKLVQMCHKLTINNAKVPGDAAWYDSGKSYSYEITQSMIDQSLKDRGGLICDKLKAYDFGDFYNKKIENGILSGSSYIVVNISKSLGICTTADEFITWFNESNVIGAMETPTEIDLTDEEIAAFKALASYYPTTNVACTSDQLDGHVVFDYPISLASGWDYLKTQLGDTRDYLYNVDLLSIRAYVASTYAATIAEMGV